jgi:D-3-phosphoglycerate dehydrogenase
MSDLRVLVVGDPFMSADVFERSLKNVDGIDVTSMQISRTDSEPPRTESEARLREYAGDPATVVAAAAHCDVLVVHGAPVSAEVLALPDLKLVCCARGGPVNVDVAAATALGVQVVNSPGKNARAVAELTVAFGLLLLRRIPKSVRYLLGGGALAESAFEGRDFFGREASDSTLGLIGLGHVGREVAELASALGMEVLGYDPYAPTPVPDHVELVELDELLARSDVVSLHARVTDENRKFFNAEMISKMRPGAALINTAREALVDEEALLAALRSGHLSGAALDVVEKTGDTRHPLLDEPSVVITPHLGGATDETLERGAAMIASALSALVKGQPLPYLVNPTYGDTVVTVS